MRDRTGFLQECAERYGDYVPLRFGPRRALLVSDPDAIAEVLVAESKTFAKPYILRTDRMKVGDGRLGDEGDFWREQRIGEPAFKKACLMEYGNTMVAATDRMLSTWRDGETRDMLPEMMRLALQVAGETLFGADLHDKADDVGEALEVVMNAFVFKLSTLFLIPDSLPTRMNIRARRAKQLLNETVDEVIRQRKESGQTKDDLLGLLLKAAEGRGDAGDAKVRQHAMTYFLAGHETTALTLTWAWHLVTQHPEVAAKLAREVDEALGGRLPRPEDLGKLKYTESIVNEAMRLYPPLWVMGRIAVEDTVLGQTPVSKGTVVMISQWVMHRDARFFDEPERFKPERWENGLARELHRYAFFPFGGGPRGCIGSRFAMMEAVLLMATIAQRFSFAPAPGHTVEPLASITLRPKDGVKVRLQRQAAFR
jgi:cytochrome P450